MRVAARLNVAWPDVVGVASVSRSEVKIAVRPERDRAAVVVACVLAKGDDLTARCGIDDIGIRGTNFPFVDCVYVVLDGPAGTLGNGIGCRTAIYRS